MWTINRTDRLVIIVLLYLCLLSSGTLLRAQQDFLVSQFQWDPFELNPAYAGMDDALILTGRYRNQWQGLAGNPEVLRLGMHLPLYAIGAGAGLRMRNQLIGAESNLEISACYSQVFPLRPGLLTLGFSAGIFSKTLDGLKLITGTGEYGDNVFDHHDPNVPPVRLHANAPAWGIGLGFLADWAEFGIVFDDFPVVALDINGTMIQKRHSITIHGNYFINLQPSLRMEINGMLRSDFIRWQTELGVGASLRNELFTSIQLRGYSRKSFDALIIGIGGTINDNLSMAYSYDITLSPLRKVASGAHEILLRYKLMADFGKKVPEPIIHSPRLYE